MIQHYAFFKTKIEFSYQMIQHSAVTSRRKLDFLTAWPTSHRKFCYDESLVMLLRGSKCCRFSKRWKLEKRQFFSENNNLSVSFFKQALSIDFACVLIKFTCALSTISNITFFAGTNQCTIRDTTSRLWVAIVGKTCAFINILKMKKGGYLLDISIKIKAVGTWQWPATH